MIKHRGIDQLFDRCNNNVIHCYMDVHYSRRLVRRVSVGHLNISLNAWSYRVRQAGNFGSSMLNLGHLQVTWLTRCNTWKFSIGSTRFCFWRWKSHTSEIIFQTVAFNQFKMLFILVTLKLKISKRFLSASSSFYQHKFLQNRDSNHRKLLMISQKN